MLFVRDRIRRTMINEHQCHHRKGRNFHLPLRPIFMRDPRARSPIIHVLHDVKSSCLELIGWDSTLAMRI